MEVPSSSCQPTRSALQVFIFVGSLQFFQQHLGTGRQLRPGTPTRTRRFLVKDDRRSDNPWGNDDSLRTSFSMRTLAKISLAHHVISDFGTFHSPGGMMSLHLFPTATGNGLKHVETTNQSTNSEVNSLQTWGHDVIELGNYGDASSSKGATTDESSDSSDVKQHLWDFLAFSGYLQCQDQNLCEVFMKELNLAQASATKVLKVASHFFPSNFKITYLEVPQGNGTEWVGILLVPCPGCFCVPHWPRYKSIESRDRVWIDRPQLHLPNHLKLRNMFTKSYECKVMDRQKNTTQQSQICGCSIFTPHFLEIPSPMILHTTPKKPQL